jgi:hypothetical protein
VEAIENYENVVVVEVRAGPSRVRFELLPNGLTSFLIWLLSCSLASVSHSLFSLVPARKSVLFAMKIDPRSTLRHSRRFVSTSVSRA